jgi:hypothetical protein
VQLDLQKLVSSKYVSTDNFFYHASHWDNIHYLTFGIECSHVQFNKDFSNGGGFYLTPELATALDRCETGMNRYTWTSAGIAIYAQQKEFSDYQYLNLHVDRRQWTTVVNAFRSGRRSLYQLYQPYQLIDGPIAEHIGGEWTPSTSKTQVCVRSDDVAEKVFVLVAVVLLMPSTTVSTTSTTSTTSTFSFDSASFPSLGSNK